MMKYLEGVVIIVLVVVFAVVVFIWLWSLMVNVAEARELPADLNQFNGIASVRLQSVINSDGVPPNTPEAWVRVKWQQFSAPDGCGVHIFEADTVTPLAEFDCLGEYALTVQFSRGLMLSDGTDRLFPSIIGHTVRVNVLPEFISDEVLFGDWGIFDVGVESPVILHFGERDQ